MKELILWGYIVNAVLLINHEIDSAYWREWNLFNLKFMNGISSFLIIHFPVLFIILAGAVLLDRGTAAGYYFSFILCAGGIFAFLFHTWHLRKGRPEFNSLISKIILYLILFFSLLQAVLTTMVVYS